MGTAVAQLSWDAGITNAAGGGTGTWINNGVTLNWFNGASNVAWSNGNSAVFGGSAGVVSVDNTGANGAVSVSGLTFSVPGYEIAGQTLTLGTNAITANANSTISATLTGAAGINLAGTSTLTLSADNSSTLSGASTIGGTATLAIASDGNLGANAGLTIVGGTLRITDDITSARAVTIGTGGGTIQVDATKTLSLTTALVTSANGLIKNGTGTLSLNTNSSRTGTVTIDAGTLQLNSATAWGTTAVAATINNGGSVAVGNFTLGNGGSIAMNTGSTLAATAAGSRVDKVINVATGAAVNFDSGSAESNILVINGGGNTRLTGGDASTDFVIKGSGIVRVGESGQSRTHAATGDWLLQSGIFRIRVDGSLGATTNDIYFTNGTLDTDGQSIDLNAGRVLDFGVGGGTLSQTANTLTLNDAGQIAGAGNITKVGGGTVLVSAANTGFTGDVSINAGTFDIRNVDAIGTGLGKADIALNAGTLNLRDNGTGSNGTISYGHNVTLGGAATISVDRASGSNTGNTIALGTLKLTGDHTLTANNANSYGLSFTTLDLENTARTFTKAGGATLILGGISNAVTGNTINQTAGTLRVPLASIPAANFSVNVTGGTIDLTTDVDATPTNLTFPTTASYGIATGAATPGTLNKTLTITGSQTIASGTTLSVSGRDDYRIYLDTVNNNGTLRSATATYRGTYINGTYTGDGSSDYVYSTGNTPSEVNILSGVDYANSGGIHFANGVNSTVSQLGIGESASIRNGSIFIENGSTVTVLGSLRQLNGTQGTGSHQGAISLRGGSKIILNDTATIAANGVAATNFFRAMYGGDGNANNVFEIKNTAVDFGASHGTAGNSSTYIKIGGLNFMQHASNTGTTLSVDVASTAGRRGYLAFEGLDNGVNGASAGWTIKGAGNNTDGIINVVTDSASAVNALRFNSSRFVDVQGSGQINVATNVTTSIADGKTVNKIGTGSMNFNGAVSGTGTLQVTAGSVALNNASFNPNLSIPSGSVTGGVTTGQISTLGSLSVGATGTMTLSPAAAATTWNVGGSTTIVSGATFNFNITDTAFDRISSTGVLALDNGIYSLNFTKTGGGTPSGWINPIITGSSVSGGYGTFNSTGLPGGYNLSADGTFGNGVFVIIDGNAPTEWFPNASGNWSAGSSWIKNGVNPTAAPNGIGASALFGDNITANRIVTLDTPQTLGSATFLNGTASYTLDTSTSALTMQASSGNASLTAFSGSHTISGVQGVVLNSTTEFNAFGSSSLAIANISGANGLINSGTIAISGINTYSGPTTVLVGTTTLTGSLATTDLSISNGATLVANSGSSFNAVPTATINGTLTGNVNVTLGTAAGTGTLGMAGGTTLTLGRDGLAESNLSATVTSASPITLVKTGDSTIVITSVAFTGGPTPVNNWTGDVQVTEGTLVVTQMPNGLTDSRSLPTAAAVNVSSGATLAFRGTAGATNTFANSISGPGIVRVLTTSQQISLNGTNTYTGGTELESGTNVVGNFNGTTGGLHGDIRAVGGNPIAQINLTNGAGPGAGFTYDGSLNDAGGSLRVNFFTPAGVLAPNQRHVVLSGTHTMTGTLSLGKDAASDIGTHLTVAAGAATLTGNPNLSIENGTLDWVQAVDASYNSIITNSPTSANLITATTNTAGRFIKSGAGNLTLTNPGNNFAGIIQVQGGTLTGTIPTLGGAGAVVNNATLALDSTAGTFAKSNSGTGLLILANGSTVTLSGTNTHTGGTRVSGGSTLTASNTSLGGTTGGLILDNGTFNPSNAIAARATLQVTAAGGTINHDANQVSFNGGGSYNFSGNLVINGSTGSALNLAGGAGPVTVATGTSITVNNGAKLNIDATAGNPLQDSVTATNRVNIVNDSTDGFNVTAGNATAGLVSGTGTTTVTTAGATLTANHVRQAGLTIGAGNKVTVAANGTNSGVSRVTALSINTTGQLNLNNNDLIVDNGNLAAVTLLLKTGLDISGAYGGGPGITSTTFAANPLMNTALGVAPNSELGYATFSGQAVDADDILVKYTYFGDADLNGVVDTATDFDLYITGLTSGGSLGGWLYGDFDYNGTVDSATDFDLYITGLSSQSGALLTAGSAPIQAVPEPGSLALAVAGLLGVGALLRRRRRCQQDV